MAKAASGLCANCPITLWSCGNRSIIAETYAARKFPSYSLLGFVLLGVHVPI